MKIFRKDLSAIRRETLEATSVAASRLSELRAERQAALLDSSLEEIEKHDAGLAAQERRIATLQEKLRLLTDEQHRERHDEQEQNRAAAVKRIAGAIAQREQIAAELEITIKRMSELWFSLAEFRSPVAENWPFPMLPGFGKFDLGEVSREMALALFSAARPVQGRLRMPQASALDTGVAGRSAEGITNLVTRQNAALLAALGGAPLGDEEELQETAA